MNHEILNTLGIEQWHLRPELKSASTILVVTQHSKMWSAKNNSFFNQILASPILKGFDVKFCVNLSADALLAAHIRLVWFLGEPSFEVLASASKKPTILESPSLDILMETGSIKKEFYRKLCDVASVLHSSN